MALNREGEYPKVSAMERVIPQRALIIMTSVVYAIWTPQYITTETCEVYFFMYMYVCMFFFLHQHKIAQILHSVTHIRQNIIINSIESMGRNKFQWDEKRKDPKKKSAKM